VRVVTARLKDSEGSDFNYSGGKETRSGGGVAAVGGVAFAPSIIGLSDVTGMVPAFR